MRFLSSIKLFWVFVLMIALTQLIAWLSPSFIEFYIEKILKKLHEWKSAIIISIHFPLGEILYILLACILLYFFIQFFRTIILFFYKKNKKRKDVRYHTFVLMNSLLFVYLLFYFNWILLYSYTNPTNLEVHEESAIQFSPSQNDELVAFLYQKLITLEKVSSENSIINRKLRLEYQKHFTETLPYLNTQQSLFGSLISMIGISGYYHPITGESYIDGNRPKSTQSFVIAHEMAHQLGVASESEANYTAYWICVNSSEPEFQYSAYLNVLLQSLYSIRKDDSTKYQMIIDTFQEEIKKDILEAYEYRLKNHSYFSKITLGFYNWFLEKNNKGVGLRAYGKLRNEVYEYEFLSNKRKPEIRLYK